MKHQTTPYVKIASVVLVLVLVILSAACSNSGTNGARGNQTQPDGMKAENKGPVKLRIAYDTGENIPSTSADSNEAVKYLENRLGVKFELMVNTTMTHKEKIRVQIASGDIPDAFVWKNVDDFIVGLIKAGVIVPVDKYLDEYPNLKKQKKYQFTKYKDQTWAITGIRNPVANGDIPLIRQDWLDNLKLEAPKTLDDLYRVARAFTYDDPDKNGKKDTYGIQLAFGSNQLDNHKAIWHAYGYGADRFVNMDGKIIPQFAIPAYKDFLGWMQKAYKDGLIDPDFAVSDVRVAESNVVRKGQAGIFFNFMPRLNDFEDNFMKTNPNAKLVPFEPIKGPTGKQGASARVNFGGLYISKKAADDPDKIKKIFEWLDFGASDEGLKFKKSGVEGVHYTVKDGKEIVNSEAYARDLPIVFVYTSPMEPTETQNVSLKNTPATQKLVSDGNKMIEKFLIVPGPLNFAYSETGAKYTAEADAFINNNMVKVIMGAIDVKEWDTVIKQWYDRFEGNKWVQELAAAVSK